MILMPAVAYNCIILLCTSLQKSYAAIRFRPFDLLQLKLVSTLTLNTPKKIKLKKINPWKASYEIQVNTPYHQL